MNNLKTLSHFYDIRAAVFTAFEEARLLSLPRSAFHDLMSIQVFDRIAAAAPQHSAQADSLNAYAQGMVDAVLRIIIDHHCTLISRNSSGEACLASAAAIEPGTTCAWVWTSTVYYDGVHIDRPEHMAAFSTWEPWGGLVIPAGPMSQVTSSAV